MKVDLDSTIQDTIIASWSTILCTVVLAIKWMCSFANLFILLTLQYACFPLASNYSAGFFSLGGLKPNYYCHDTNNTFEITADEINKNSSQACQMNNTFEITADDINKNSSQACQMVRSCSNISTENAWYSMYEEYEWVCAPDYVRSSVASFIPFATMIGYLLSGHLSDYFGRKWLMVFGFGTNLFCGFAQGLTPSWEFYIVVTVIAAISGPVYHGASFALMVESVNSKYRMIQGFAFQWSIGYIWVCAPDYVRSSVASFIPFATMIGYLLSGHLSDYFGRKWLMVFGFGTNLFCGFAQGLTPSWEFYIVVTVIAAISGPVYHGASFALMVESVNSKYRMIQGFAFQWSIGYILAGLSAYLTGNWRRHLLVMNTIGIPPLIAMLFIQESPRFLLQKGKYDQAAATINRIAKFNNMKGVFFDAKDMVQLHVQSTAAL
uniref:MFS domain-containing protein n=1 Tax=Steinernema glaseri TaxID=37863 RepID=A0A1I7YHT2_9BILA